MPRALVLCEYATLNGGERSLLAVLPHLQRAGWLIDAFAPTHGALAQQLRARNVAIYDFEFFTRLCDRKLTNNYYAEHLTNCLENGNYDLLHSNSLAMGKLSGPIAAKLGVPSISHLRDILRLNAAKIQQLNCHTRLLAVSEAVRSYHVAQGLDASKVQVLHNGIDLTAFLPSPLAGEGLGVRGNPTCSLRAELELSPNAKLIGLIGQIILRKGQDTALAAVAPLLQNDPSLHVVVLGARHSEKPETVEYEHKLHAIAAEVGVADRVHYLGTRDDVPQILPQFTLLLHMARQEPLGRVLLEASACGVPVVATDVGGTREIFPRAVEDGALLVSVDDPVAARMAVQTILADDALARRMGLAGRKRIEAAFSVEQSAAGLLRHYDEVSAL